MGTRDVNTKQDQPTENVGKGGPKAKEVAETTDAGQTVAQEQAAEKAAAPKPKPKPKRKPAAKKAAATAADRTGVGKEEAAAAKDAEDEPKPKPKPKRKPAAKKEAEAPKAEAKAKPGAKADERPVAPPVVRAQARYVRTSARKARLVCDHIRGKRVDEARAILAHTSRAAAEDWRKLLESAIANAENNHELVGDDLRIASVHADEGPTLKRFRPRAQGRATRIRKRTSHLTITLTPKE
jgi:ribosomal protein L22